MRFVERQRIGFGVWVTALGLVVLGSPVAGAAETRFRVDPDRNLAELAQTGRVAISIERSSGTYTLDASAVLPVPLEELLRVSADYGRHAEMGIPNLRESRVVWAAPGGDRFYAWSSMNALGRSSEQYLEVEVRRNLTPAGAVGIRWTLAPRRAGWPYEDASVFTRLDGSWYLEPLADGTVYVRYFLTAVLAPSIPDGMISWVVKRELRDGTRGAIRALAREAARRGA